jgi:hypothetical protein
MYRTKSLFLANTNYEQTRSRINALCRAFLAQSKAKKSRPAGTLDKTVVLVVVEVLKVRLRPERHPSKSGLSPRLVQRPHIRVLREGNQK